MTNERRGSEPAGNPASSDPRPSAVSAALRATSLGALLAGGVLAVVLATAVVPAPMHASCAFGLAIAVVCAALGNLMLASAVLTTGVHSAAATTRALFADLALHVVLGGGISVALFLLRTKYLAPAAFALAFAASAAVLRITGAGVLSRVLKSEASRRSSERRT